MRVARHDWNRHTARVELEHQIAWLGRSSRSARYLVGVSGGADSVALLRVLVKNQFNNLIVCHLDHQLRGRASTEDARFVARLAENLGLPSEIGRIDVGRRIRERGASMETAARQARHEFFAQSALKHDCRRIILAHHADDQAETAMWNLLRGSYGLKGMREEQQISVADNVTLHVIRPLLGVRHAALVGWLKAHGYRWREDASNLEPVAIRNRLRNEVFPLLDAITGRDAVAAFARGAADTADRDALADEAIERARVLDPQGRMHLPALRKLPVDLQRTALRTFLREHGIPSVDRALLIRAVALIAPSHSAVVNLPGGAQLRRREGRLMVEKIPDASVGGLVERIANGQQADGRD